MQDLTTAESCCHRSMPMIPLRVKSGRHGRPGQGGFVMQGTPTPPPAASRHSRPPARPATEIYPDRKPTAWVGQAIPGDLPYHGRPSPRVPAGRSPLSEPAPAMDLTHCGSVPNRGFGSIRGWLDAAGEVLSGALRCCTR
jgi:hypothetical protein